MEIIIARRGEEKKRKKNRMNKQHMKVKNTQHEISNSLLFYYSH